MSKQITLYHFTDSANVPSIRERGLVPAPLLNFPGKERRKGVWLTVEPEHAGSCDEEDAIMLTVWIDEVDPHLKHDAELDPDLQVGNWRVYYGVIPPTKIDFPDDFPEGFTDFPDASPDNF